MARRKITAYIPQDDADTLKRLAAIDDKSVSDLVADAIRRRLNGADRSAGQAAILASLSEVSRRLTAIEDTLAGALAPGASERERPPGPVVASMKTASEPAPGLRLERAR